MECSKISLDLSEYSLAFQPIDVKSCFSKPYDCTGSFFAENGQVDVTCRTLDNGDIFIYMQAHTLKPLTLEVALDKIQVQHFFDGMYKKPPFDNRYGENNLTGPFAYLDLKKGSAFVSKVYCYKELKVVYNGMEASRVLELVKECDRMKADECGKLSYYLDAFEGHSAFYILLSSKKLFSSRENLQSYMQYFFESVENNAVQCSFFMLLDGTYTKLPYSIEPFSKQGYGYSLHHSSRRDMVPFLQSTGERFFEDFISNGILQANLYCLQRSGVFVSAYTSKWLKDSTGITAPYVDTRLNEFYILAARELHALQLVHPYNEYMRNYLDFLCGKTEDKVLMYCSASGFFFQDYFKDYLQSHSSLNHQLGTAILFAIAYIEFEQTKYLKVFMSMLGFLADTSQDWLNKESGDIYYGIRKGTKGLEFFGKDYVFVTLVDLLNLQDICINWLKIGYVGEIKLLVDAKLKYLAGTEYNLFSETGLCAPGEDIRYREQAARLYEKLYGKPTGRVEPYTSIEKRCEGLRREVDCLSHQLESMASKYTYEQAKVKDLDAQLGSMASKYAYEQAKVRDLDAQLGSMASKYAYEQAKVRELDAQLGSMASKYTYEQAKAEDLTDRLGSMTSKYLYEQKALSDEKVLSKNMQITLKKTQTELDMYRNSRLMQFMRYWAWHVPTAAKRRIRRNVNQLGRSFYIKLLPYPRIRTLFSKLNGKLGIYKNPQEITGVLSVSRRNPEAATATSSVKVLKIPSQVNVAMILDEFSYNCFRYECNAFPLNPDDWLDVFENNEIDFLFCESAWSGTDSVKRPWKGQIYASVNFPKENRGSLLEILDYCKRKGIPTVFWNKEDPTHFDDRVHDFVKTALSFDHIFTTAEECIQRYKYEYGHKSVHLMMFATQPRLFNPIEKYERTDEVVFAGSWYRQHTARSKEMEIIFDTILAKGLSLKVYDRHWGVRDPNHQFPEKFMPFVNPGLSHIELEKAYKSSKYGLNITTVTDSKTMFARRVFELMSSNTLVLSNYSEGLARLFGDNIVFIGQTLPECFGNEETKRQYCLYSVLRHHTYTVRLRQILDVIGLTYVDTAPLVTFRYSVESMEQAKKCVRHYHNMEWENKKCCLIISKTCHAQFLREIVTRYNRGSIVVFSAHFDEKYRKVEDAKNADRAYTIEATTDLAPNFVKNAFLHVCYLEENTAIASGDKKFKFQKMKPQQNMLIPPGCLNAPELNVYVIPGCCSPRYPGTLVV